MRTLQNILVFLYGLFKKLGFLKTQTGQDVFRFAYFQYKKYCEDPFSHVVKDYPAVFSKGHILDVGGNIGYTSVLFSTRLSPGFKLYSFEPEGRNYALLTRTLQTRGLNNRVIPVHAAVGEKQGSIDLWLNPTDSGDHRVLTPRWATQVDTRVAGEKVPLWSIDAFLEANHPSEPVSFIKIDVQGYEPAVCAGMAGTLRQNPQCVVGLEYAPECIKALGFNPEDVLDFFREKQFLVYLLTVREGLRKSSYSAITDLLLEEGYVNLLFSRHSLETEPGQSVEREVARANSL